METKRLLVLSDTHGNIPPLEAVLKWAKGNYTIDTAVFLGDGIQDLRTSSADSASCEWRIVRGNNDFEFSVPECACLDWCGYRFFLCHGHRYVLYRDYETLAAAARNMNADAALFGHTHVPSIDNARGLLLINPGSIGRPRGRIGASFAIIEHTPGMSFNVRFWGINSQAEIKEIKVP